MAVWLQVKVRGRKLSLRPIGCTPALSVTQKKRSFSCRIRPVVLYECHTPLPVHSSTLLILVLKSTKGGESELLSCGWWP